ncbi:MAG: ANTAR domain-containing protein [Eubacteriales bacterium]
MENILIVSSSDKETDAITKIIKTIDRPLFFTSRNGKEARHILTEIDFDVIVVNTPLQDEFGHEFALVAMETTSSGIVMLVSTEIYDEVEARMQPEGILLTPKPINRDNFFSMLKLAQTMHKRISSFKTENVKLQKKLEDNRLIGRAKLVLIQSLGLNEPQAHRYIEKQAMDMRITKKEVAKAIIKTYEN